MEIYGSIKKSRPVYQPQLSTQAYKTLEGPWTRNSEGGPQIIGVLGLLFFGWGPLDTQSPYTLSTFSTHLLCPWLSIELKGTRKEGNVLFNDALNTFYLRLYGIRHMVKDHSDSKKGNPLPPHRLPFRLTTRVLFMAPSHRQDSTYHGLCYTSRGALAGTRNSSIGPPHQGLIRRPIAP